MNRQRVAVVVPIYKADRTAYEEISYQQLFRVLGNYDIFFVLPEGLELKQEYHRVQYVRFSERYFASTRTYSELMLSVSFYEAFQKYEFILLYQLDAFVFADRLPEFCKLPYDYIGAPWLCGYTDYERTGRRVLRVGNGGLSLRRVRSFLEVLQRKQDFLKSWGEANEDVCFSACEDEGFRVAPPSVALSFAFEREVRHCYECNQRQLPFGCHAWEKYDLEFWKERIQGLGYVVPDGQGQEGKMDELLAGEYRWLERTAYLYEKEGAVDSLVEILQKKLTACGKKEIYLWGAGIWGKRIGSMLTEKGLEIKGYLDGNPLLQGTNLQGRPVCSPESLEREGFVIVSTAEKYYGQIEQSLQERSFIREKDYCFWETLLTEVWNEQCKGEHHHSGL